MFVLLQSYTFDLSFCFPLLFDFADIFLVLAIRDRIRGDERFCVAQSQPAISNECTSQSPIETSRTVFLTSSNVMQWFSPLRHPCLNAMRHYISTSIAEDMRVCKKRYGRGVSLWAFKASFPVWHPWHPELTKPPPPPGVSQNYLAGPWGLCAVFFPRSGPAKGLGGDVPRQWGQCSP